MTMNRLLRELNPPPGQLTPGYLPQHEKETAPGEYETTKGHLGAINVRDVDVLAALGDLGTQATLAAILAKLIAAPATEATLAAVKAAVELDSRGLFVNRPTAAAGQFKTYWSVDTGDISVSDGTTWKTIGVI